MGKLTTRAVYVTRFLDLSADVTEFLVLDRYFLFLCLVGGRVTVGEDFFSTAPSLRLVRGYAFRGLETGDVSFFV